MDSRANYTLASERLKELGVSMVREDLAWINIEKSPGIYDFTNADRRIEILRAQGIETLPILTYSNPLYAKVPAGQYWAGDRYTPPLGSQDWENYKKAHAEWIYQAVKHLKEKYNINYVEIWNEPYGFWEPTTENLNVRAVKYTELMKMAYPKAKQANPNVKVIIGGLGTESNILNDYITYLYAYGISDYFDIMNIHPYINYDYQNLPLESQGYNGSSIDGMLYLRNMMRFYGDGDKDWWITEFGYPTDGCHISYVRDLNTGKNIEAKVNYCYKNLSTESQVARIKNIIKRIKADFPEVKAFFWYDFKDDCLVNSRYPPGCTSTSPISEQCPVYMECRFGLVNNSYYPKPAFYAYKEIIKNG